MPPVASYGDSSKTGIAGRLEALRAALGFDSQVSFADHLGFSPAQYGNYVQARNRISLDEAIVVAHKTQATLDWIYLGNSAGLPWDLARSLFGDTVPEQPKVVRRASRGPSSA